MTIDGARPPDSPRRHPEGGSLPGGEPLVEGTPQDTTPARTLDLRGEVCPYTLLYARLALEEMASGAEVRVLVDSAASARDVPRGLTLAGHRVRVTAAGPALWVIDVRRATG